MVLIEEELAAWTVDMLKDYLTTRGVTVSGGGGRKADLIRKVLAADLLQLPTLPSMETKIKEISDRRRAKLMVDGVIIPFPEDIAEGWMKEFVYFPDVTMDCLRNYAKKSISEKGFKEGANLHRANHVRNVEFNNISDCIKFGFFRGQVVPQTRVSEKPYKVWVCLNLSTCEIFTGECGCIAGYSESCKHVFALLHFVEHHVSLGDNKTCTSKKQTWHETVKKGEKVHPPVRMNKVSFDRPHPEYVEGYIKPKRTLFDPRPIQDRETSIDWNKLSAASGGNASVLCFKRYISDHQYSTSFRTNNKPEPMVSIIANLQTKALVEEALQVSRTLDHISDIEALTKGQSENSAWFDFRKGVITASISHNVLSKVKNPERSTGDNIVARVLGYTKLIKTTAMSWGIEREKFARKRYVKEIRKKHTKFSCEETGLILHPENVMLGASVDGRVKCDCCGVGNLEIKCPFSHRDKNIEQYVNQRESCLIKSTDAANVEYHLKCPHPYYTQIQHQMYVTGALYTDFVVFLPKQSATVRVMKDNFFAVLSVPKLKQFFYDFIVPEMLTKTIYDKHVCKETIDSIVNKVVQAVDQEKVQNELNQLTIPSLPPLVTSSTVSSGVKRKNSVPVPLSKKK